MSNIEDWHHRSNCGGAGDGDYDCSAGDGWSRCHFCFLAGAVCVYRGDLCMKVMVGFDGRRK